MRREERVTVQGPVKEQQPDGMSHRGVCFTPHCMHYTLVGNCCGAYGMGLWDHEVVPRVALLLD